MDKIYFKKDTLARIEHFGILIMSLDGKRFLISEKYKNILHYINGSSVGDLKNIFKNNYGEDEIEGLISTLTEKTILINSSDIVDSKFRIVENKFISEDCLSFPRTVYWELTQSCNLECIHCYSNSQIKGFKGLGFELIKERIDEFVDKGVEFLNIGGGEPLMYKDIFKFLEYASSKGLMIEMTTNGTLLNENSINLLGNAGLKYIQVSLDGATKETYEKIRKNGNFEKVIKNIIKLKKSGFIVSVNTVLMRLNYCEIIDIIELCKRLDVDYYKVSPLMETGRVFSNTDSIQLSLKQYKETYSKLIEYKNQNSKDKMKIIIYQNILKPELKNISWMPECHYGCPAGRTTCGIDSYGNVYPCSYMNHEKLICGNILQKSLSQIWTDSLVMNSLRSIDQLSGKCGACKYLRLCRGGCRAMAYLRNKSLNSSDPLCVVHL